MEQKEIRMRCIEAISASGIREPSRLIRDAAELAEWVNKAEADKDDTPRRGRPPTADKGSAPA